MSMSVLVVGSVALDSVETPHGEVKDVLGGSATYFSYAASFFTKVRVVGVVGTDFPAAYRELLEGRGIDLSALEVLEGATFRWHGRYFDDLNSRDTIEVQLNVFEDYQPKVPEPFADTEFVFLANGSHRTQKHVLEQLSPKLVFCDTMNLWISQERQELLDLLRVVDGFILNDSEAALLTEETNLVRAGQRMLDYGPRYVVIKKGAHGAMLFSADDIFTIPAYPLERVVDPTGAGDSFAGGMMGYLAREQNADVPALKKALVYATILASFTCEGFSLEGLQGVTAEGLDQRYREFVSMMKF